MVSPDQGRQRPGSRVLRPDGRRPPTAPGPLSAPMTIDTLLSADGGDGSGAWFMSLLAQMVFPSEQLWGDVAAVGQDRRCARPPLLRDRPRPRVDHRHARHRPHLGRRPAGRRVAGEPGRERIRPVRDSDVETLVIGGKLDFATPPQWATRELLPHLPNGHEVVLDDFGHTTTSGRTSPKPAAG